MEIAGYLLIDGVSIAGYLFIRLVSYISYSQELQNLDGGHSKIL